MLWEYKERSVWWEMKFRDLSKGGGKFCPTEPQKKKIDSEFQNW